MSKKILSLILSAVLLMTGAQTVIAAKESYTVREAYMYFAETEADFILSVLDNGYEAGVTESQLLSLFHAIQRSFYLTNRFENITSENFQEYFFEIISNVSNSPDFSNIQNTLYDTYPDAAKAALDGVVHKDFMPLFNSVKEMILEHDMMSKVDTPGDLTFKLLQAGQPKDIVVNQLEPVTLPDTIRALSESGLWVKVPVRWNEEPDTAYPGRITVRGRIVVPEGYRTAEGFDGGATIIVDVLSVSSGGKCGSRISWSLENGVLTISGSGAMHDYDDPDDVPWAEYRDNINKVVIGSGVTSVGKNALSRLTNLANRAIKLPSTLRTISSGAFAGSRIESVVVPTGIKEIASDAFDPQRLTVYGGKTGGVADKYCQGSGARFVPDRSALPSVISLEADGGKVTVNSMNISSGLYAAQYGEGMRLLSLEPVKGSTIKVSSDEVRYVKVFLWEEGTMVPVCPSRITRIC